MRVGQHQLRLLMFIASPWSTLVTPDKASRSLVKRGLFKADEHGGCTITPAGLRVLADELEAGRDKAVRATIKAEQRTREAKRKAREAKRKS